MPLILQASDSCAEAETKLVTIRMAENAAAPTNADLVIPVLPVAHDNM